MSDSGDAQGARRARRNARWGFGRGDGYAFDDVRCDAVAEKYGYSRQEAREWVRVARGMAAGSADVAKFKVNGATDPVTQTPIRL